MDLSVFTWIGIITSLYVGLKLVKNLCHFLTTYVFLKYPDFSKYGSWSVVTGATDGIGEGLALELASRGQNIILLARNEDKLKRVSKEIESKYGVETKYLKIDFSHDESIYDEIQDFLKDVDIGVLVNNVSAYAAGAFFEMPQLSELLSRVTRVNIFSVFKMHQIVLPGMMERGRGLVINITGAANIRPVGYASISTAAKALHDCFSQSLSYEVADKGITIQSVMPFFVPKTNNNLLAPTPKDFAKSALATIGGGRRTYGYWAHVLQGWMFANLPGSWVNSMMKKAIANLEQTKKNE